MDQDTRNHRQYLQTNHPGTEEEGECHQNRSGPSWSTTTEKTKHQNKFKRTLAHSIINLSRYQLTPEEKALLSKGLNFIPTPNKEYPAQLLQDILLFDRKLRLNTIFIKIPQLRQLNLLKMIAHIITSYIQVLDGPHP